MDVDLFCKGVGALWLSLAIVAYIKGWDWFVNLTFYVIIGMIGIAGVGMIYVSTAG